LIGVLEFHVDTTLDAKSKCHVHYDNL